MSQEEIKEEAFVFISYATSDRRHAEQLKSVLEDIGYSVWLDRETQQGELWHYEIENKLNAAASVVVLWSNKSAVSTWVKYEAAHAIGRGVYIGCRIEKEVVVPSNYSLQQDIQLCRWNGMPNDGEFPKLHSALSKNIVPFPNHSTNLVPFSSRWPDIIPRSMLISIRSWTYTNALGLLALLSSFAIVFLVYLALRSQLSDVRNTTQVITSETSKARESLNSLTKNITTLKKSADSLKSGILALEGKIEKVGILTDRLAFENSAIQVISIVMIGAGLDINSIKPDIIIGHNGVHLLDIDLEGPPKEVKRDRLKKVDRYRGVLGGILKFSGGVKYTLGIEDENYALIESIVFRDGYSRDRSYPAFIAAQELGYGTEQGMYELRINTTAIITLLDNVDESYQNQQQGDQNQVKFKSEWPLMLIRDLKTASIGFNDGSFEKILLGINDKFWIGVELKDLSLSNRFRFWERVGYKKVFMDIEGR